MAEQIDSLYIEIDGVTSGADESLAKLESTLARIQNFSNIAKNISTDAVERIGKIVETINSFQTVDTGKVDTAITVIQKIADASFKKLADNVSFADSFDAIANISGFITKFSEMKTEGIEESISAVNKISDADFSRLNSAVAKIDSGLLQKANILYVFFKTFSAVPVNGVERTIRAMQMISEADFTGMARSIMAIPVSIGDRLEQLGDGLSQFSGSFDTDGIGKVVDIINKMAKTDFWQASDNVRGFDTESIGILKGIMDSLSGFDVDGAAGFGKIVNAIDKLAKVNMNQFAESLPVVSTAVTDFITNMKPLIDFTSGADFANAIQILNSLQKVTVKLPNISTDTVEKATKKVAELETKTKATGKSVSKFSKNMSVLMSAAKNVGMAIGKITFGGFMSSIDNAVKRSNKFMASLSRIVKYRALRLFLQNLTKGLKEGIDNLYQFSKAFDGEFSRSLDTVATAMLYYRNSFAAMVAPLINYFAPVIDMLVDKAVELMNFFNKVFAKFTCATYWTKAKKYPKEYADAVKQATKAIKDYTMGFDELNVISDSGSVMDESAIDYGSMFDLVELDRNFEKWIDEFKRAIRDGDFGGAGKILATRINEVFDNVDIDSGSKRFSKMVNNAVSFLNGMFDNLNFRGLGRGIAKFFNNAIKTVDFKEIGHLMAQPLQRGFDVLSGFVNDFDFSGLGKSIGKVFNGFWDNIDVAENVNTIQKTIIGMFDTIQAFFDEADFTSVGSKIGEAVNTIDAPKLTGEVFATIMRVVSGAFDLLTGFLENVKWYDFGKSLSDSMVAALENIDVGELASKLFRIIGDIFGAFVSFNAGVTTGINEQFIKAFSGLKTSMNDSGKAIGDGLLDGIAETFKNIGNWIVENIFNPFMKGLDETFEIKTLEGSTITLETGKKIMKGLFSGMSKKFDESLPRIEQNLDSLGSIFRKTETKVAGTGLAVTATVSSIVSTVEKIKPAFEQMQTAWGGIWTGITNFMGNTKKSIVDSFVAMVNGAIDTMNHLISYLNRIKFSIPGGLTFDVNIAEIPHFEPQYYATGGHPKTGQLFVANEAGAEMIGNIGGRTTVATNDDIVEAVSEGVYNAVMSALSSQNGETSVNVYLDGKQITSAVENRQRTRGKTIFSGGVVNA